MNLQGLKINFLGDSITEGHGCSGEALRFADRIAAEYGCTLCVGVDAHSPRQLKDEESINGAYQFAHSFDLPVVEEFDLRVSKLR